MRRSCDCFANLTWEDVARCKSKSATQRLIDWGWMSSCTTARPIPSTGSTEAVLA